MWRMAVVQTVVHDTKVKFAVFEREVFDILKAPGERGEFRTIDADIEIGNCNIPEPRVQQRIMIPFASASDENPHLPIEQTLIDELFQGFLIVVDHEARTILRPLMAYEAGSGRAP